MTQRIYQTAKSTLASLALGGALALTPNYSNGKENNQAFLPVQEQTIAKFREQKYGEHYDRHLSAYKLSHEAAIILFNNSISDYTFSVAEQQEVYNKLIENRISREIVLEFAAKYHLSTEEEIKEQREVSNLYKLLDKNLTGIDHGRPELEKTLEKQGIYIKVGSKPTQSEKGIALTTLGLIGLLAPFSLILIAKLSN